MWVTIPLAGAVAAVFGCAIGAITLRLQGPYFVIVTLAFAEVLRIVANNWIAVTNGPMGLAGINQFGITDKGTFFHIVLALAAVALYLAYRFVYSNAGRAAVALRENRYVAQSIGVDPFGTAVYSSDLWPRDAGLAGGFYAHYISFVGPEVFQFPFMATMVIMVVLGGKGTLLGPIAGAVIVTLLEEYLREMQDLLAGLLLVLAVAVVLFLPNGLMGFLTQRREKQEAKPTLNAPVEERTV